LKYLVITRNKIKKTNLKDIKNISENSEVALQNEQLEGVVFYDRFQCRYVEVVTTEILKKPMTKLSVHVVWVISQNDPLLGYIYNFMY